MLERSSRPVEVVLAPPTILYALFLGRSSRREVDRLLIAIFAALVELAALSMADGVGARVGQVSSPCGRRTATGR
jgi:hypothetical protein